VFLFETVFLKASLPYAVDSYHFPFLLHYVAYDFVLNINSIKELKRTRRHVAECRHVQFLEDGAHQTAEAAVDPGGS